jgi:hypothetical protein
MTEAEWLGATDPTTMLRFLRGKVSDRKLWLFSSIEFMRTNRYQLSQRPMVAEILRVIESSAEGIRSPEIEAIRSRYRFHATAWQAAWEAHHSFAIGHHKRNQWLVSYIRCVFGNPFRPVDLIPSWLTSTALALANGIYDEKAFDRMPILADALQDAGCDSEDILNHCRQPGEHVKGCWVVDLLSGRN